MTDDGRDQARRRITTGLTSTYSWAYTGRLRDDRGSGVFLINGHEYDSDTNYLLPWMFGVVRAQRPTAAMDSGTTWGTTTGTNAINTALDYAEANVGFSPSTPHHFLGISHGGLLTCQMILRFPARVKSAVIIIPVLSVTNVYSEDRGGFASSISTAWGGVPPAASNPLSQTDDIAATGVPILCLYSTTDTITLEAESEQFISETGCDSVNMGAAGHFYDPGLFESYIPNWITSHDA